VRVEKKTVSLSEVMTTCYLHISVLTSKASQDPEITDTSLSWPGRLVWGGILVQYFSAVVEGSSMSEWRLWYGIVM
jgi:hypothetical protein